MLHARSDYDEIQDPRPDGIPADEPVFLLRARDVTAPHVVEEWARGVVEAGGDPRSAAGAAAWAEAMRTWQKSHGSKVPDLPTIETLRVGYPAFEDLGGAEVRRCGATGHGAMSTIEAGGYTLQVCRRCRGVRVSPPLPPGLVLEFDQERGAASIRRDGGGGSVIIIG
jgi:hypothetical protein